MYRPGGVYSLVARRYLSEHLGSVVSVPSMCQHLFYKTVACEWGEMSIPDYHCCHWPTIIKVPHDI